MAPSLSSLPFRVCSPSHRLCSPVYHHVHTRHLPLQFRCLLDASCHYSEASFIPTHSLLLQESALDLVGSSSQTSKSRSSFSSSKSRRTSLLICSSQRSRMTRIEYWVKRAFHLPSGARGSRISPLTGRLSPEDSNELFWKYILASVTTTIADLTPLKTVIWTTYAALALMFIRWICRVFLLNPKVWMFGSWFLVVWPWPAALLVGSFTLYAAFKHYKGKATQVDQFVILAGSLVWLILVPLAHVHGYVDGWPLTLFFLYLNFFLLNPIIRMRLYDDLSLPSEDKEWDMKVPMRERVAFAVALFVGHVFAALEAPPLLYSWNRHWQTNLAVLVLMLAFVMHWYGTYFLGKYSFKLVKPQAVVMFGPYRFIRHPIYASFMLLYSGYCLVLRSYLSLAFLLMVCLTYYERLTQKEEQLLEEKFGALYKSYKKRVFNKYFLGF